MNLAARSLIFCSISALAVFPSAAARNSIPAAAPLQTSDRCMVCHNGMRTASGEEVSFGHDWRGSMMANSARDPYWQASVRRETADHPASQAAIEDECAACHMPISRYLAHLRGEQATVFSQLALDRRNLSARQSLDGVSCSVCHQIGAPIAGAPANFNGDFVLDAPDPRGHRPVFGPFAVETGDARVMRSSSEGYEPAQDTHIRESELCATCHTQHTRALGTDGKQIGTLPEQMPYEEWLHSEYKGQKSCQGCHAAAVESPVAITRVLGQPREGVRRHVFAGSNAFMLRLLDRFRDELGVAATPEELRKAAAETEEFLQSQALRISIANAAVRDGRLRVEVALENLAGHKLPSGYPSRRLWLHVTVRKAGGGVVFESGASNADGSIRGNSNDADPAKFEPHYDEITSPQEVQVYESILGDSNGAVTTGLLSAVRYLKDNRLLPRGFEKSSATPDIAVVGAAAADSNFTGGGDRVTYSIPWDAAGGAFEIEVEALYQPIGHRWAANLKRYPQAEPMRFAGYYDAAESKTIRMASATRSGNE